MADKKTLEDPAKFGMYVVKDKLAETHNFPFASKNHATAMREFMKPFKSGSNSGLNIQDYSLMYIGEYDQTTGFILPGITEIIYDHEEDKK